MNGAKVVKSLEFADGTKNGVIHEMDGFISPSTMWRYVDQREFGYIHVCNLRQSIKTNLCIYHKNLQFEFQDRIESLK